MSTLRIWVRGVGELGSALVHLLHRMGFKVYGSELEFPLSIRRPVCFSEAILQGETQIDGVSAYRSKPDEAVNVWKSGAVPILLDDEAACRGLTPNIFIDARMLKQAGEDIRPFAELAIGLGPGFSAGTDCHLVIETNRGHELGRLISNGSAAANTGIPGELGGKSSERLLRATGKGKVSWHCEFGQSVSAGQTVGELSDGSFVKSRIAGILRGMISPEVTVTEGMKIGDVDPRGQAVDYKQISEKSRLIAYAALEAILLHKRGPING